VLRQIDRAYRWRYSAPSNQRARLQPVAIERDVMAKQRLDNEVRDHATVVGVHPRTVGIEYPCDLDRQIVLPTVVEEQGFRATLALVVAGARTDRIDVPPIVLALRVNAGIAIDLRGRGLQNSCPKALS